MVVIARAAIRSGVGATNDVLDPGVFERNKSYVIGTTAQLLANDTRIRAFTGLTGADANGALEVTGGSLQVVNGEIIFTTNDTFEGGEITFGYTAEFDTLSKRYSSASVSIMTELKPPGELYNFDDAVGTVFYEAGAIGQYISTYKNLNLTSGNFVTGDFTNYFAQSSGYVLMQEYPGDLEGVNGFAIDFTAESNATDFDFISGQFSAAWNTDLQISVTAYDDGLIVGSALLQADPGSNGYVYFIDKTFDRLDSASFTGRFTSIDKLVFGSYGGVNAGLGGSGNHFVTDNWTLAFE
jgi:hypothetical protein